MRISDWSSDVCSSDLLAAALARALGAIPVSVSIARSAEADGVPLIEAGYHRVSIPWHDSRVREELVFAVLREEFGFEIGSASCRERVCQYVSISVVAVSLKRHTIETYKQTYYL